MVRAEEITLYLGDGNVSASRWLRRFNKHLGHTKEGKPVSPGQWLKEMDVHLSGNAAT